MPELGAFLVVAGAVVIPTVVVGGLLYFLWLRAQRKPTR